MAAPHRPLASQAVEPDRPGGGAARRHAAGLRAGQRGVGAGRRVGATVAGPGAGTAGQHPAPGGGRGGAHAGLGGRPGVAGGALRLSRTPYLDLAAGGAAGHPALHHGLRVHGTVRLLGSAAAPGAAPFRTRRATAGPLRFISRRRAGSQFRHLPLRLPVEPRRLHAHQRGLRGGRAAVRRRALARLAARGAADAAAGDCGGPVSRLPVRHGRLRRRVDSALFDLHAGGVRADDRALRPDGRRRPEPDAGAAEPRLLCGGAAFSPSQPVFPDHRGVSARRPCGADGLACRLGGLRLRRRVRAGLWRPGRLSRRGSREPRQPGRPGRRLLGLRAQQLPGRRRGRHACGGLRAAARLRRPAASGPRAQLVAACRIRRLRAARPDHRPGPDLLHGAPDDPGVRHRGGRGAGLRGAVLPAVLAGRRGGAAPDHPVARGSRALGRCPPVAGAVARHACR